MTQAAARTPGTLTPAGCAPASAVTPDAAVLERNLRALSRVNPHLAQIIAENSLVSPIPESPPLVIPVTDAVTVTITTDSGGSNVVSTDTAPVEAPPAEQ